MSLAGRGGSSGQAGQCRSEAIGALRGKPGQDRKEFQIVVESRLRYFRHLFAS